MFKRMFVKQLFDLFVVNPNLKAVKEQASAWKEETVRGWAKGDQDFAEYVKTLSAKEINKELQECKKEITAVLASAKVEFQTEFPRSGIQILSEARENRPGSVGEQALDAIARLLLSKFPRCGCVSHASLQPKAHCR
jgi:hypothetical protein